MPNRHLPNFSQLSTKRADQIRFKSNASSPIQDFSLLRRSLLFAEVALISYLPIDQCFLGAEKLGFREVLSFKSDGIQAYWLRSDHDSVIVCRGHEFTEWNSLKSNAIARTTVAETVGRVHIGFKREADDLWPRVEHELEGNAKPLWFCGHSIGGALAVICASRCLLSYIKSEPVELHTFGSPRVGNRLYSNHATLKHFRWVNNNDLVPRLPPSLLGYAHSGTELYLNYLGQVRQLSGWRRIVDRAQGSYRSLLRWKIDQLSDHSIIEYIDAVFEAVRAEESSGKGHP